MKNLIKVICIACVIISCSRSNDTTEPELPAEKTNYSFTYNNSYKVNDIVLYKGPVGEKVTPKESYIQDYWSTYSVPDYDKIDINLNNKSIQLYFGKNVLNHQIELSHDSIYTSKDKTFIGVLDRKTEKLELAKSFYYIKKSLDNSGTSFNRFTKLGLTKHKDIFDVNTFNNPSEMTDKNDEIFWANVSFSYKEN